MVEMPSLIDSLIKKSHKLDLNKRMNTFCNSDALVMMHFGALPHFYYAYIWIKRGENNAT